MTRIYYKHLYLSLLSACGGGGGNEPDPTNNTPGGTTPPDTTAPTASLVPVHSSSNVDSTTNIVATFDEDMFASTINASNFTLRGTGDNIDATVSFDALSNIATLNPNTTLGLLKTYTARLKPGITDLSGNALALTTATFTTRDGSWNGPAFLLDGASGGDSDLPDVAVSPNGNAIVVFEKLDGAVSNIYANHYSVNDGWSGPVRLDVGNVNSDSPQVTIDANGNAVAVWIQGSAALIPGNDVYASRYTIASGWETAEIIDNSGQQLRSALNIAMDSTGNATVVWSQVVRDSINSVIRVNSYNASTGNWGAAATVTAFDKSTFIQQVNPKVAFGSVGSRVISWTENGGNLVASIGSATTTSVTVTVLSNLQIDTSLSADILYHQAIIDSDGNATIIWQQPDTDAKGNDISQTYARYFSADGISWSDATLLEAISSTLSIEPSLAVDPSGNIIAVWLQFDGTRYNIWANRFSDFSKTWGTAELIEGGLGDVKQNPGAVKITAADINTFSAIWNQANDSGGTDVWANRFTPRGSWGTAEMIESSPGSTKRAVVDFDSNGNGIAVWIQRNTGRDAVLTRHFN